MNPSPLTRWNPDLCGELSGTVDDSDDLGDTKPGQISERHGRIMLDFIGETLVSFVRTDPGPALSGQR
jgi:hypothetical protein